MTVYSLTITESTEQLVYGIPRSISIESNVPAVIFYSFDGPADATSNVYLNSIQLPQRAPFYIYLFVTNGIDTFSTSYKFSTQSTATQDLPVTEQNYYGNLYPFTDNQSQSNQVFGLPAFPLSGGDPVSTPYNTTGYPTGYNADGYHTGYTNKPYTVENYTIKGDYFDKNGFPIVGIGFGPPKSHFQEEKKVPIRSNTNDMFFDPKALIIFQDFSKEDSSIPPVILSQNFSLPLANHKAPGKDFKKYYKLADETFSTGSFARQYFSEKDNTLNYYYHDNRSNRWIISKVPYTPDKLTYTNPYNIGSPWKIFRHLPNLTRQNPYW